MTRKPEITTGEQFRDWFNARVGGISQDELDAVNAEANAEYEAAHRNDPSQQFARAMEALMAPRRLPKREELDPDAA